MVQTFTPAYIDLAEIKRKREEREKELFECTTIEQKIALKQVWAIQDIKIKVENLNYSRGGLFGLF